MRRTTVAFVATPLVLMSFSLPAYSSSAPKNGGNIGETFLPVEHCSYDPIGVKPAVHADHAGRCDNTDAGGTPYEGSCDYSSGFYWTSTSCNSQIFGCELSGQIRCPNGSGGYTLRTYNFYCPQGSDTHGNPAPLPAFSAGREEAKCDSYTQDSNGNLLPYSTVCNCSTSQSYWDYNCVD